MADNIVDYLVDRWRIGGMRSGIPSGRAHRDARRAPGSRSRQRTGSYVQREPPRRDGFVGIPGGLGVHHHCPGRARRRGSRLPAREGIGRNPAASTALSTYEGMASSYDAWEKQGAIGWNYQTMLPYLKRSERRPTDEIPKSGG